MYDQSTLLLFCNYVLGKVIISLICFIIIYILIPVSIFTTIEMTQII